MESHSNTIIMFIIDQLRADYIKYFQRCSNLLTHSAICTTNSMPASTEAMHTNISTGLYPKDHGFISKKAKMGEDGLEQLIRKLKEKDMPSLASLAFSHGFSAYVIGGKEETVRVMGSEEDCALMVHYDKHKKIFVPRKVRNDLKERVQQIFSQNQFEVNYQKDLDKTVLMMANNIIESEPRNPSFYIFTLSSLDSIGHTFGPDTPEVHTHLTFLDNEIYSLIENFSPTSVIITGDHGCRKVSRYIIEPEKDSAINVYCVDGQTIKPFEQHTLITKLEDIQYDGGLLRLWINGDNKFSDQDLSFFSKYGYVFPHYIDQGLADEEIRQIYKNSVHENMGGVFVIAHGNATFCKRTWVDDLIYGKITQHLNLDIGDLPIGEHGTYHQEDRQVCFLSNRKVKKEIRNVEIYNFIRTLME